jgi:outer membrane protein OmpA-like peptidoglycan-associated protein
MIPPSFFKEENMTYQKSFLVALCATFLMTACGDKNEGKAPEASAPAANAPAANAPTAAPQAETPPAAALGTVPTDIAPAAFDIEKIPVTNTPLGEFPFFTPPEGTKYVSYGSRELNEGRSLKGFDRYYFVTGKETLHAVEGKVLRVALYDVVRDSRYKLEVLRVERNYENAITAAGGVKVFDGIADRSKTYNTLSSMDQDRYGPGRTSNNRQTYVIRRPDAEIWIEVNCDDDSCYFTAAQKGEMKQSVGLIPASALKEALDKEGHVALYINFDVDKSTIRPESEPIVAEIFKLLDANPDLRVRIEGHTDNTGEAAHNQTLSENRAAAVFGALLAKGIAQSRLESAGFGATKPIADNNNEEGKAKNRRVEIVKL